MMTTETQPDLIVFGANLAGDAPSQEIYEAKGYLCDLTTFLDSDPELQKSDFLPNVLAAFGDLCDANGDLCGDRVYFSGIRQRGNGLEH